jgi:uroporphyrinogen-III synthase
VLVLVTRPRAQAEVTAAALRALGHEPLLDAMLEIEPLHLPDLAGREDVAAVVLTSANAVTALPASLAGLPVFAVGAATAAAARAAGCRDVRAGSDDGRALAGIVASALPPGAGAVLHLAAEEVREGLEAGLRAAGLAYRRAVAYRALPSAGLAPATGRALAAGRLDAALFFSPRTAAVFAAHVRTAGIGEGLRATFAACLSPAVADEVRGLPWREVRVAAAPGQAALLALLGTPAAKPPLLTAVRDGSPGKTVAAPAGDGPRGRDAG